MRWAEYAVERETFVLGGVNFEWKRPDDLSLLDQECMISYQRRHDALVANGAETLSQRTGLLRSLVRTACDEELPDSLLDGCDYASLRLAITQFYQPSEASTSRSGQGASDAPDIGMMVSALQYHYHGPPMDWVSMPLRWLNNHSNNLPEVRAEASIRRVHEVSLGNGLVKEPDVIIGQWRGSTPQPLAEPILSFEGWLETQDFDGREEPT